MTFYMFDRRSNSAAGLAIVLKSASQIRGYNHRPFPRKVNEFLHRPSGKSWGKRPRYRTAVDISTFLSISCHDRFQHANVYFQSISTVSRLETMTFLAAGSIPPKMASKQYSRKYYLISMYCRCPELLAREMHHLTIESTC